jgi:hypothetical protein
MIELVLIYCLGDSPPSGATAADNSSCIEKRLPMEDFSNPNACMMGAQQRAQEYLVAHPKWHLSGWRCEVDLPKQKST